MKKNTGKEGNRRQENGRILPIKWDERGPM